MPTIKLTQAAVERLKPPAEGRAEYWDATLPAFGLRVAAARPGRDSRKTWQVMLRVQGKQLRHKIGTTIDIPNVADARDRARKAMQKAQQGINPAGAKQEEEQRRSAADDAQDREAVTAVVERYLDQHGRVRWRADTFDAISSCLRRDVLAVIGNRSIHTIQRRDVRELIDGIVARGRAPHASHVLAYLRPALKWAVDREIITTNPAAGIGDPDPRRRDARARDRYLDDREISLFWGACEAIGWPFGPLFKTLLLTAQRRDELADARWREIDLKAGVWTLPRHRAKNDKAHVIHLAPLAVGILSALPRIGTEGFVFTTAGTRPVSGFTRARERLAAAVEAHRPDGAEPVAAFTLHDLRRSAATGMAALGVGHHVVDRILNHSSGKISGVAAIYNRFEYLEERKAALDLWAAHIGRLTSEPAAASLAVA